MTALGFFGKLPAVGDFVNRGIDRAQMKAVDAWLQLGLTELAQRDAQWLDHYLIAPVWCFAVPAGQWSEAAHYGALMASVDRVGRYFPLLVIGDRRELLADRQALHGHLRALARVMPEVLWERLTPEVFVERLQHLADREPGGVRALPSALQRFNPEGELSAWWTEASPEQPGRELSHVGRPDAGLLRQLFSAAE